MVGDHDRAAGWLVGRHAPWASNVAKTAWPEPSDWGEVEKSLTVERWVVRADANPHARNHSDSTTQNKSTVINKYFFKPF